MSQTFLEVLLWILLSFFVGCILGYLLRLIFRRPRAIHNAPPREPAVPPQEEFIAAGPKRAMRPPETVAQRPAAPAQNTNSEAKTSEPPAAPAEPVAPVQATTSMSEADAPQAAAQPSQPRGIAAPRGGTPDNLQQISGVGPKIELTLHRLGIFHFDQIAGWTTQEAQWVDDHLKFKGRIERDEWIKQARQLASGKTDERGRRQGSAVAKKPSKPKSPRTRRP